MNRMAIQPKMIAWAGRRFGRAVAQAAREGTLLLRDAYRLTGPAGRTFERFTKGLSKGIGG